MAKHWRPDGWLEVRKSVNPYTISGFDGSWLIGFEAGADAMCEALRKQGQQGQDANFRNPALDDNNRGHKGTLVFIPDDKEE